MDGDMTLVAAYREYLRETLKVLRIKLVISLGHASAWFLGPFYGSKSQIGGLSSPKLVTVEHLDQEPWCERDGIVFVKATHPSFWGPNSRKRCLKSYGDEIGLLIAARRLARIPDVTQ